MEKKNILIADSGSTKTDWAIVTPAPETSNFKFQISNIHTQGINPVHQSREEVVAIVRDEFLGSLASNPEVQKLRSASVLTPDFPEAVYFYGSGVRPELEAMMVGILKELFHPTEVVEAHSDLLGAARALCGREEGIACILGTGANSCLYDGEAIARHTPALGYILGDEGSGAVLGKRFLHDLYGDVLSEKIKYEFEHDLKLSLPEVISRVYRKPLANRFLASLSEFIGRHIEDRGVRELVVRNFADFLSYHVAPYGRRDLPVSFVGSVAWYFQDQLREAADSLGYQMGTVLKSPLEGLVSYHQPLLTSPKGRY